MVVVPSFRSGASHRVGHGTVKVGKAFGENRVDLVE